MGAAVAAAMVLDDRVDVTTLGRTLSHAAFTVAECLKNGVPVSAERNAEAEQALGRVEAARAELAACIKGRLDARSADLNAHRE